MEVSVRIRVRAFENLGGPVVSRDSFTSKIPSCAAPCIDSDESQNGCSRFVNAICLTRHTFLSVAYDAQLHASLMYPHLPGAKDSILTDISVAFSVTTMLVYAPTLTSWETL